MMNKIFSAVALAATVVTLTLASADVLASSGKGKDAKGSTQTTSQSSTPGNSADKGNGADKSKGHSHNHSNGNGHANHQGNGYGHDHDEDDDDGDSCDAPDADSNGGNGHSKHKGKGHQHDHTGYINGVGHHKHHDHDDDDSCGGGDNGGGDNGGGDNGGGVVLPEGCFAAAAWIDIYVVKDGFIEATEVPLQSTAGVTYGKTSFTYITDEGLAVGVTPAADHWVYSYSISRNVDGLLTDIKVVNIPDGAIYSEVIPGEINLTQAQAEAGLGITALICVAGATPDVPAN